jgi:hypothetical protein
MCPILHHPPALDGDDPVGVTHRREPMRDDGDRPFACGYPHGRLYHPLALILPCARRLVNISIPVLFRQRGAFP